MKRTFLLLAVVFLLAGLLCPAQEARPNFTGKWVLDTAKSDFGPVPGPSSRNDVIDHQDPKLKLTVTSKGQQGELVAELNYTTDGKENTNTIRGREVKSKTRWEGKQLVTEAKMELQGNTLEIKDTWELSGDGKVLTIGRELKSPQGEASQKLIFNKE